MKNGVLTKNKKKLLLQPK
jgi:small subunit ribosomal protein S6e